MATPRFGLLGSASFNVLECTRYGLLGAELNPSAKRAGRLLYGSLETASTSEENL